MKSLKKSLKDYYYRFRSLPEYFGQEFKRIFAFLLETGSWSPERIAAYKLTKLRELLIHARNNVPYYKGLFKDNSIIPEDVNSFEDYKEIPILSKSLLRENLEYLKSDNFESFAPIKTETSGTTGQITTLYRSRYHEAFRKAVMWRFYHQQGFHFGDTMLTITSPAACDPDSPLYERDRVQNKIMVNTFHLMCGNKARIAPIIYKYKPKMIWAHPNLLCVLADHLIATGEAPLEIELIATYGEKIYPHVRKILNRAFKTRFVEYFGNRENSIASWGISDDRFFEISEYCHLEVAEDDSLKRQSPAGKLISTSLHNYAVPLIRYDSEDVAEYLEYPDPVIPYPAVRLWGGRGKDLLLSEDGLIVPYTPHQYESSVTNRIKKYQIEQLSMNEIVLRVVPLESYDRSSDESDLLKYFGEILAGKFRIKIEYVEDIPFTSGGKYPVAVSPMAVKYLAGK